MVGGLGRLVCAMDGAASTTLQVLADFGRPVAKTNCDASQYDAFSGASVEIG